jgi:hypothetical protein
MSDEKFERARAEARKWEQKAAAWLRRRGWHVLATYDFSGKDDDKAPKLLAPPGDPDLVLPDLQMFKENGSRWVEVKYKAKADDYRIGGYRVTGISRRLWGHYQRVEEITGADVFIVFLHGKENEIRGERVRQLRGLVSHTYSGPLMGRHGMIFFRFDELPNWGPLSLLEEESPPTAIGA